MISQRQDDPDFEVRLLGRLQVCKDGKALQLGGPKQRAVFAVLAYHANSTVSKQVIIDSVWGDFAVDEPPDAPHAISDYISRVRGVFKQAGLDEWVQVIPDRPGWQLRVDPERIDWHRFLRLRRDARRAAEDYEEAVPALSKALELWRGRPLADLDTILDGISREMTVQQISAAEELARFQMRFAPELAADTLANLVADHPEQEGAAGLLVTALAAIGNRDDDIHAVHQRTKSCPIFGGDLPANSPLQIAYEAHLAKRTMIYAEPVRRKRVSLPPPTVHFTNRRDDLEAITARLLDPASTTVVICAVDGMAGVGKTALAIQVAHRLGHEHFPDGRLFLDLRGYTAGSRPTEPAVALETLLRGIGVPAEEIPAAMDDRVMLWRDRLTDQRMLIILDNAYDTRQVLPLIPSAPGCRVLITSRRKLTSLDDADPHPLNILDAASAITLFCSVAGMSLSTDQYDLISKITLFCGRLPLAIRIAAAQIRNRITSGLPDLTKKLEDARHRLAELKDRDRDIAALFAVSYAALPPTQQRMFTLLGLVPGPDFDRDAAAALTGLRTSEADQLLRALFEANLLIQQEPGRYRFHDLLRVYASSGQEDDPASEVTRRAHDLAREIADIDDGNLDQDAALHRLAWWYTLSTDSAVRWLVPSMIQLDRPNVDAVPVLFENAHAAASWLNTEQENLLAVATVIARRTPDELLWHLTDALRRCWFCEPHSFHWVGIAKTALDFADEHGNPAHRAAMHLALASSHAAIGNRAAATGAATVAAGHYRGLRIPQGEAIATQLIGHIARMRGMFSEAATHFTHARDLRRQIGDDFGELSSLGCLSAVETRLGRLDDAARHAKEVMDRSTDLGYLHGLFAANVTLGFVHREYGEYHEAHRRYSYAAQLAKSTKDSFRLADAISGDAAVYCDAGQPADAMRIAQGAWRAANSSTIQALVIEAKLVIASAHLMLGDLPAARGEYEQVAAIAEREGNPYGQAQALLGISRVSAAEAHIAPAVDLAHQAGEIIERNDLGTIRGHLLTVLAQASSQFDQQAAARAYNEAVAVFRRTRQRPALLQALIALAGIQETLGDEAAASTNGQAELLAADLHAVEGSGEPLPPLNHETPSAGSSG